MLEGEQDFILPSADSEQAITSKIFSFSSWPLALSPPNTLERDLKPGEGWIACDAMPHSVLHACSHLTPLPVWTERL